MSIKVKKEESNSKAIIVPIIKGMEVIKITINGGPIPLKRNINFKEFTEKLLPLLMDLENFLELSQITIHQTKEKLKPVIYEEEKAYPNQWDISTIKSFWFDLDDKQREFVKIVYDNEELEREHLTDDLVRRNVLPNDDTKKYKLAGISAALSRKWNSLQLQPLWIIKKGKYIMNLEVIDLLSKFLENGNHSN